MITNLSWWFSDGQSAPRDICYPWHQLIVRGFDSGLVIVSHRKLWHIIPEFLDHCLARVCGSTRWQIIELELYILLFLTDGKITKVGWILSDVIIMMWIGYVDMIIWSDHTRHDASKHVNRRCGTCVACCLYLLSALSTTHRQVQCPQMFINKLWRVD